MRASLLATLFTIGGAFGASLVYAQDENQASEQKKSLPDLIESVERSVVVIETDVASGSGFLVTTNGIIVTNHHVIEEGTKGKVTFVDKKEYDIEGVLLDDPKRDIAILKINSRKSAILAIATTLPRKGETVYTIGAPRGFNFSISEGIVSAIRPKYEDMEGTWIQTTAPVSPGNSGGPLINTRGEVVGMNTFANEQGQNLNFSLSCKDISQALIEARKVKSPILLSEVPASSESITKRIRQKQVSDEILRQYFNACADSTKDAIAECKKDIENYVNWLAAAKRGVVNASLNFNGTDGFKIGVSSDGKDILYFKDEETKSRTIESFNIVLPIVRKRLSELLDPQSKTLTTALHYGPELQFSTELAIGRVREMKVLQIGQDIFVAISDNGQLLMVEERDTSDLEPGLSIRDEVFLYVEDDTVEVKGKGQKRIHVVQHLSKDLLTENYNNLNPSGNVAGASANHATFRQWKDKEGKLSVKAKFMRLDGDNVFLQPDSGLIIKFPLEKLSIEDQKWILDFIN
jgi:S1-C subfamily serine protease